MGWSSSSVLATMGQSSFGNRPRISPLFRMSCHTNGLIGQVGHFFEINYILSSSSYFRRCRVSPSEKLTNPTSLGLKGVICTSIKLVDAARPCLATHEFLVESGLQLVCEYGKSPLVGIDSLHVWARAEGSRDGRLQNEYEITNRGIAKLVNLASELNEAKGSGDIEYLTETMLELEPSKDGSGIDSEIDVRLTILKNRHGSVGATFDLKFSGAYQSFRLPGF